jgi:hypothetical protein
VDESARQDFTEFVAARSRQLTRLAYVLTGEIASHGPHDQLAIIVAGHIYARPVADGAITSGRAEITGLTRAAAEFLLRSLLTG